MADLQEWIAGEARFAAKAMCGAISAAHIVMERPGLGQTIVPRPGSVLASPVTAHYDPDPDYFFHWFRDSAIVIDALRVALAEGFIGASAVDRFREFVAFSSSLRSLNGQEFLRENGNFREKIKPFFLQYVRSDAELAAVSGETMLDEVRVNADGTLDFTRWSRPQADGPAVQCLALLRWQRQCPHLDASIQMTMRKLINADLGYTLAHAQRPSFDIWEEESGFHYYTRLVQTEALTQGAEWFDEIGQNARAHDCRVVASHILSQLDALWDKIAGFYRSRGNEAAEKSGKELDIAVILAVIHAGRKAGAHSVLDPKVQATLTALEELFEADYAINRNLPDGRGPAMGRYANDAYYSGGAYFFATLAAAEFYFKLAAALRAGAEFMVTAENERFRRRLGAAEGTIQGSSFAAAALRRGDSIIQTVRVFTLPGGELSEQFDRTTGVETSAKQLSWSYAAFITAAASRSLALRPIPNSSPAGKPAGTA